MTYCSHDGYIYLQKAEVVEKGPKRWHTALISLFVLLETDERSFFGKTSGGVVDLPLLSCR